MNRPPRAHRGPGGLPRREALRLALTTGSTLLPVVARADTADTKPVAPVKPGNDPHVRPPWDPDLRNPVVAWPMTLSAFELETLRVLVDVILPSDDQSPAASQLGAPAFIDEWVSAPYPTQQGDALSVRGGLAWMNSECERRFGKDFMSSTPAQQQSLCDELCFVPKAKPEHRQGAIAFDRIRALTLICYATSDEGMRDLGYVGNRPQATFEGATPAILRRLKIL